MEAMRGEVKTLPTNAVSKKKLQCFKISIRKNLLVSTSCLHSRRADDDTREVLTPEGGAKGWSRCCAWNRWRSRSATRVNRRSSDSMCH